MDEAGQGDVYSGRGRCSMWDGMSLGVRQTRTPQQRQPRDSNVNVSGEKPARKALSALEEECGGSAPEAQRSSEAPGGGEAINRGCVTFSISSLRAAVVAGLPNVTIKVCSSRHCSKATSRANCEQCNSSLPLCNNILGLCYKLNFLAVYERSLASKYFVQNARAWFVAPSSLISSISLGVRLKVKMRR